MSSARTPDPVEYGRPRMLDDERSATDKVEEVRHEVETVLEEVDEYLASHDEKSPPQEDD